MNCPRYILPSFMSNQIWYFLYFGLNLYGLKYPLIVELDADVLVGFEMSGFMIFEIKDIIKQNNGE